ncbi:MAG: CmcJ/NvfI family oxidoreductase [Novosphingobium sp.]|nr:CmcJ/NvfI family oxidoreductase [Novosphingobium sp.]
MIEVDMYYASPGIADPELHGGAPVDQQIEPDFHRVMVSDARALTDRLSLDREGFVLCRHSATTPFEDGFVDFNLQRKRDLPEINRRYGDELLPLIGELSGADEIVLQAGRMTVRATPQTGLGTSDSTASLVHLDYTPTAVRDAIALTFELEGRPVPPHSRVALFQTWRVLSQPPHDSALAICDARTVSLDASIPLQTFTEGDGKEPEQIEVRLCTHEPGHKWYYFSDMKPEELLVFKGYDSADPDYAGGAHVAFDDPGSNAPNGRISVEARFLAFYI